MNLDPEQRQNADAPRWHLKREIQLGHLITTITVAASAMWYVNSLEHRIGMIEAQIRQQVDRDERQDKTTAEALTLLRQQLDRMDGKLDRLIEKGSR